MRRTFPRRTLLLAAAIALGLLAPLTPPHPAASGHPDGPDLQASATGEPYTISPSEGETGTVIEATGRGCVLPGTDVPGEAVVVRLRSQGATVASVSELVRPDGSWSVEFPVPRGTPTGTHNLQARCVYPGAPDPVAYGAQPFTVTGEGATAAAPPTPRFNGGIEPFAEYDGQSTCSPSTKPGMARFMNMVMANYGGGSLGVGRGCGAGGTSEHKEGRAWDWAMNAGSAGDRARVQALMDWLFATDAQCNHYARARRLGMMYIIWNRRMFRMYDTARGWAPYSGPSPHTDHVHFSLTRRGGAGSVSFYNPTYRAPDGWTPGGRRVADVRVGDQWDGITPLSGDFDGDGYDDLLWYDPASGPAVVWFSRGDGRFAARTVNMGAGRVPLVGDFNGDCREDVFWYGPGAMPDRQWQGRSNRTFRSVAETMNGTYTRPFVGDFNGDRADDIYWYEPGPGADRMWRGTAYGFVARDADMAGDHVPVPGDFDGDFRDDILWYGPGTAPDRLWYGRGNGFTTRTVTYAADRIPVPGDFNGDDRTDVLWYGVGEVSDRMWLGRSTRGFKGVNVDSERPYASAVAADVDGDTHDDVFWHESPFHEDRLWRY